MERRKLGIIMNSGLRAHLSRQLTSQASSSHDNMTTIMEHDVLRFTTTAATVYNANLAKLN